ncbi:MAG: hypothetical protein GW892_28695 [Armatimonadetes bacterium]|nr:hypothetical protein [Armatimonadota bacterium]NCQ31271.1 hypothetical protein [Armatimonadota bacterium]
MQLPTPATIQSLAGRAGRFFVPAAWSLLCVLSACALASPEETGGPEVLFRAGFDETPAGDLPMDWLTTNGTWTVSGGSNRVARQADPKLSGQATAALTWVNYDLRTTVVCREHRSPWGMGLFAYWQDNHNYYRLSNFGDQLVLVRCLEGVAEVLGAAPATVEKGQPWTFRLVLSGDSRGTRLRGRAWPSGQAEPAGWPVEAYDFSRLRHGGAAGVWCAKALCQFSEVVIQSADPAKLRAGEGVYRTDFSNGVEGQSPPGWFPLGGDWRLTGAPTPVLEQRAQDAPLTFNANAFCLLAEWSNYTVAARLRAVTGRDNWGFGLAAYYQNEDNNYRLYSVGDTLFLGRRTTDSGLTLLAQCPLQFREGKDYRFRLRLSSQADKVALKGKAWPADGPEPAQWTIETEDASGERFTAGAVALLAYGAVCDFDDVLVAKNREE